MAVEESVLEQALRAIDTDPEALIAVVGPTASGKTELAIALAERLGGEIVSADSVQIYRRFDIGSGKPSAEELARVPHHLVDVADPLETFDAARIEGAGHFRMMWKVALPQLRPVTAVVVMLTIFESLKAFDLVAVMTKGAPFGTTNVLGYIVYLETFWNSRFGYGATLSVAILVVSILTAALVLGKLLKGAFDV